jgi:hypothetical protein
MRRLGIILTVLLVSALNVRDAHAANVTFDVQPRQSYVGVPVTFSITIEDSSAAAAPELPEMEDFTLTGSPARSERSFTQIRNGRTTSSRTVTYTYRLVPRRTGRLTIPAITFAIDGETFATSPVQINVEEPESNGLLIAEVAAPPKSVYVGEPVELALRITVKPYTDARYGVRLSDSDMWGLLRTSESQWGVFQTAIVELEQARRGPASRILRPSGGLSDDDMLYQYDVKQIVYPDHAGPIDLGNIVLVMQYPLELTRSVFSYRIESSRPVVAAPEAPDVNVKPLPEEGRPAAFSGAVGSFTMGVEVKPVDVAVGEPITLTLALTDHSKPAAQLDVLKAPPLHHVEALTSEFRVHEEPLAGIVSGRTKRFTQTIRAQREDVTAVPAIPFAYFDPQREAYVTIKSDPIPISVRPASMLAMSDIVQSNGSSGERATELTPTAGGILANFGDPEELLRRESLEPSWWMVVVLALPPMMFAAVAVGHRRAERLRHDPALVRQRRAYKHAGEKLNRAARQQRGAEPMIASAVAGYVADRCNLPPGAHTRADVAACLSLRNIDPQLARSIGNLMQRCEHAAYTGAESGSPTELAREARTLIHKLERARWS